MNNTEDMTRAQQMIPNDLQERVRRELEPGEMIRWMEQPIPRFFSPATIGMVLFGIPWTDSDNDRRSMDVGFMNVRDARRVERLVNELAALARQEKGSPCS